MAQYCGQCGKTNENPRNPVCRTCYYENKKKEADKYKPEGYGYQNKDNKNEGNNQEGGFDLSKNIELPVWVVILIFFVGTFIGATLF